MLIVTVVSTHMLDDRDCREHISTSTGSITWRLDGILVDHAGSFLRVEHLILPYSRIFSRENIFTNFAAL